MTFFASRAGRFDAEPEYLFRCPTCGYEITLPDHLEHAPREVPFCGVVRAHGRVVLQGQIA